MRFSRHSSSSIMFIVGYWNVIVRPQEEMHESRNLENCLRYWSWFPRTDSARRVQTRTYVKKNSPTCVKFMGSVYAKHSKCVLCESMRPVKVRHRVFLRLTWLVILCDHLLWYIVLFLLVKTYFRNLHLKGKTNCLTNVPPWFRFENNNNT